MMASVIGPPSTGKPDMATALAMFFEVMGAATDVRTGSRDAVLMIAKHHEDVQQHELREQQRQARAREESEKESSRIAAEDARLDERDRHLAERSIALDDGRQHLRDALNVVEKVLTEIRHSYAELAA